jgi:SRSO17 transposase
VEAVAQRFVSFCDRYAATFQLRTRRVHEQAKQYLSGLMQARRKNMERMAEVVIDSDEQALQHFLSNSPWDERGVLDQVAREADGLLGGTPDSALLIDESGITKKGRHSVGVSRQWNGRLGKVDNCQVGVFAVKWTPQVGPWSSPPGFFARSVPAAPAAARSPFDNLRVLRILGASSIQPPSLL